MKGIENFKGKIRYKAKVKNILFEKGRAIGVSLDNGEEIFGKTIVSNATRWDTFGGHGIDKPLVETAKTPPAEKKWKNIIYGFGHQHIGWTLGAVTGKVINSLCNDRVPNINIEPFSPERFN